MVRCKSLSLTATLQRSTLMDGEWKSSLHGWSKISGMPQTLGTGPSDHGSLFMATDPCIAPTLMEMIAPHLNLKSEQGRCTFVLTHAHVSHSTCVHRTFIQHMQSGGTVLQVWSGCDSRGTWALVRASVASVQWACHCWQLRWPQGSSAPHLWHCWLQWIPGGMHRPHARAKGYVQLHNYCKTLMYNCLWCT